MNNSNPPKKQVFLQSIAMALGTMTSRVLGLLRDMAFAAMFSRTITDAWGVAFRIPNLFRRLLGEGSLAVSFIPVFVEARVEDSSLVRSRNLVNSFYTMLLVILIVLTALGIIFAEPIVRLLVEGNFSEIPGKFELTVRMTRIMFSFIFLMSNYAFFMGILNALGQFGLPAMAPTFFNIAMIISNFVPKSWQPVEGDALAWGVIVGGILQVAILVPSLIKKNYLPKVSRQMWNPDVRRVLLNMLPGMLGTGLLQITTIINTNFASSLGEGTNTYIFLADRLLELPLSLVAVSLGTALLPTLSSLWSQGERHRMSETSNFYLRVNMFMAMPAAVGLYVLALPIVELLFQRGRFTLSDSLVTASVVRMYAFTLLASSSVRVLVPAYYAVKNTWFPAVVSFICLVVHVLVAPQLMRVYGIEGLVGSTLISATLNLLFLVFSYRFFINPFGIKLWLRQLILFLIPSSGLFFIASQYLWIRSWLGGILSGGGDSLVVKLASLIVVIICGAAVYLSIAYLMKLEECFSALNTVFRKINRQFSNEYKGLKK